MRSGRGKGEDLRSMRGMCQRICRGMCFVGYFLLRCTCAATIKTFFFFFFFFFFLKLDIKQNKTKTKTKRSVKTRALKCKTLGGMVSHSTAATHISVVCIYCACACECLAAPSRPSPVSRLFHAGCTSS